MRWKKSRANIVEIAGSTLGYKHTPESLEKMRNFVMSEEAREKKEKLCLLLMLQLQYLGGGVGSPLGEYRGFGGVERIWKFSRVAFRDPPSPFPPILFLLLFLLPFSRKGAKSRIRGVRGGGREPTLTNRWGPGEGIASLALSPITFACSSNSGRHWN